MHCWICDAEASKSFNLKEMDYVYGGHLIVYKKADKHQRCYCEDCIEKVREENRRENELYIKLKHKRMFETAVRNLEKQNLDFTVYEDAIKTIEEYALENPDKFDSSYEIMAAIVLVHNRIQIKPQYKVKEYQVDFLLPIEKLVVEIDGDRHKYNKQRDSIRDLVIKNALGPDYEIIRIPTYNLDKKAENLVKAIDAIVDKRIKDALIAANYNVNTGNSLT